MTADGVRICILIVIRVSRRIPMNGSKMTIFGGRYHGPLHEIVSASFLD
jgi:hypothetical protein